MPAVRREAMRLLAIPGVVHIRGPRGVIAFIDLCDYIECSDATTGATASTVTRQRRACGNCTAICACCTSATRYVIVYNAPTAVNYWAPPKVRLPPPPFFEPPVTTWHQRRVPQIRLGRHVKAPLPRVKIRRWRSLKEKRQAWGFC